jgi:hypothetical protein
MKDLSHHRVDLIYLGRLLWHPPAVQKGPGFIYINLSGAHRRGKIGWIPSSGKKEGSNPVEIYFLFRRTTMTTNGIIHGMMAAPMQITPYIGGMVPVDLSPRRPVVSYTPGETILKIPGRQQHKERIAAITTARIMGMELFFAGAAGVCAMLFSFGGSVSFLRYFGTGSPYTASYRLYIVASILRLWKNRKTTRVSPVPRNLQNPARSTPCIRMASLEARFAAKKHVSHMMLLSWIGGGGNSDGDGSGVGEEAAFSIGKGSAVWVAEMVSEAAGRYGAGMSAGGA